MSDTPLNLYKKIFGKKGERLAKRYLINCGYEIVECNYRTTFGEADIIARIGEELVFVEVKTRRSDDYGSPSEAVNTAKQEKYRKLALSYLAKTGVEEYVRFDVIEVTGKAVNHIVNAFN